jgi:hypothetical protein
VNRDDVIRLATDTGIFEVFYNFHAEGRLERLKNALERFAALIETEAIRARTQPMRIEDAQKEDAC